MFTVMTPFMKSDVSAFVQSFVARWNHFLQMVKRFKILGIGKHSNEEIANIGRDDLRALSDILADKPYFFGAKPTAVRKLSDYFMKTLGEMFTL